MSQVIHHTDYFDSSALVKRYLAETGSVWVQARCNDPARIIAYDAIHLACALHLNRALLDNKLPPLTLITADDDLLIAAQTEGLLTDNPNVYP